MGRVSLRERRGQLPERTLKWVRCVALQVVELQDNDRLLQERIAYLSKVCVRLSPCPVPDCQA